MFVERLLPLARKRLVTIMAEASLADAAALLSNPSTNLLVVHSAGNSVAGVVTKTDIVRYVSLSAGIGTTSAVSAFMTAAVVMCHLSDDVRDVWRLMKNRGLRDIPIVDKDNYPMGVISARDMIEALEQEHGYEEQLLRDYVMSVGYR